jgi:SAM-dependent methyltransferase
MALPVREQEESLAFETGTKLAFGKLRSHDGKRILVAGCGTLEPLVVAQTHPRAREIVAVDLSDVSLKLLKKRLRFAKTRDFILNPLSSRRLPPVSLVCADLLSWEDGQFDFILASNTLHHVANPGDLLKRLANQLAPEGMMRVVTYPKASRIWMRQTCEWLKANGLSDTQNVMKNKEIRIKAWESIRLLPENHPIRLCFESHQETSTPTGIVDAFLHSHETTLNPMEWAAAADEAGLYLVGEAQDESSTSAFLSEILPKTMTLNRWQKLQVLDDLLELCANPVLWFCKTQTPRQSPAIDPPIGLTKECVGTNAPITCKIDNTLVISKATTPKKLWAILIKTASSGIQFLEIKLPSRIHWELGNNLKRAETILGQSGLNSSAAVQAFRQEVGPRVAPNSKGKKCILPGLSITEYDEDEIRSLPEPWGNEQWNELNHIAVKSGVKLTLTHVSGVLGMPKNLSISQQACWIQIAYGGITSWIPVKLSHYDTNLNNEVSYDST